MNIITKLVESAIAHLTPAPRQSVVTPGTILYSVCGYVRFSETEVYEGELFIHCYRDAIPEYNMTQEWFMFSADEVSYVNY